MIELRSETLDFFERASLRVSETAKVAATPARVFAAFADVGSWPAWFPLMYRAEWISGSGGVGSEREVALRLLGAYRERFIAWDVGSRFSFTMTASSSPLAKAIGEDFRFTALDGGRATEIAWTLAADPTWLGKVLEPALRGVMRRVFLKSGVALEKHLRA